MDLNDIAFWTCVAAGAGALFEAWRFRVKRKRTFTDYTAPFDQAEEEARQRGDTRAIGKARRERREAVHASLRRAA